MSEKIDWEKKYWEVYENRDIHFKSSQELSVKNSTLQAENKKLREGIKKALNTETELPSKILSSLLTGVKK